MQRMRSKFWRGALLASFALTVAACGDPLEVQNPNNPGTERVLATPGDIEALIRSSYTGVLAPLLRSDGINMQLPVVAFENSAMAANFGMFERARIPREPIRNLVSDQFHGDYYEVWAETYSAISSANTGIERLDAGLTFGSAIADLRGRAFALFVRGFGHAVLAITYDKATIHEGGPDAEVGDLVPYAEVMAAALGYMNEAISIAQQNPSMTFDASWLGVAFDAAGFIRIVNSFKARFRAQLPRTPAEAQTGVDWNALIAEVDAGITADYAVVDDDSAWDFWLHDYMNFAGPWHQVNYFVLGMADQAGKYQTWMATPLGQRHPNFNQDPADPFLIVTPDRRFPQGTTFAAQRAAPGLYIRAKTNNTGQGGWIRPERGTWRWSHYLDRRYQSYYDESNVGEPMDIIKVVELRLLKAEALIRTNRQAEALPLINASRVGTGGLAPATLLGAPDCVPKLPNGTCGDLFETLKWEKRMEQFMYVYGGWYFDSRRWGDLPELTYLHYPVPARELEVRLLPIYTFGGGGAGSAPRGTYGY